MPGLPRRRLAPLAVIAALHALLIWGLLQDKTVRARLKDATPLMVWLVADRPAPAAQATAPAPPRPQPMPRVDSAALDPQPAPPRPLPAPELTRAAAPADTAAPSPPVMPALPAEPVAPSAAPGAAPPLAVLPSAPRQLNAGAIRYRVPPAIEVPLASRRLGEAGTVLLRVWVDAQGLPRQVTLHRSSGFARLDDQAIAAMRQARFQPVTDGGSAIEWLVIAPLQYEID